MASLNSKGAQKQNKSKN